jgi:hypothetical protein
MPGWIIGVRDPVVDEKKFGGRVVSVSGATVTLDREVVFEDGGSYTFMVLLADKTIGEYAVVDGAGTYTSITLDSEVPDYLEGAVWVISVAGDMPLWRVVSKIPADKMTFEITAIKYHPDKYALAESNEVIDPDRYTSAISGAVAPPTNITLLEYVATLQNGLIAPAVLVGWGGSTDPRVTRYSVQARVGDGVWAPIAQTRNLSYVITDTPVGQYNVRVRAETAVARYSAWVESGPMGLIGLSAPPPDITGARIVVLGDRATLYWDKLTTPNVSHYEVRFSSSLVAANWLSAFPLANDVYAASVEVPSLVGTYLIKAISYLGVGSNVPAGVSSDIAAQTKINVVDELTDTGVWSGTKDGVEVSVNDLRLLGPGAISTWTSLSAVSTLSYGVLGFSTSGTYYAPSKFDLSEVYLCRLTPSMEAYGNNFFNTLASWGSLSRVPTLSGISQDDWGAKLYYRFTEDDPNGANPDWTDWVPASVGDYTFRGLDYKIVLDSAYPHITPIVTALSTMVDMPDRVFGENAVSIPSGGLHVSYNPQFKVFKGLGVAVHGMASGDRYEVSNKDETGFDIRCYNSGGTPVARTFDYVASGYGRVKI